MKRKKEMRRKDEKDGNLEEMFNYNRLTTRLSHESINYIVFWSPWLISLSLSFSKDLLPLGIFVIRWKMSYVFLPKLEEKSEEWLVQSSNLRECTFISVYTVNSCDLVRHCVTSIFHRTGRGMNGDKSFERDRSFALLFRAFSNHFCEIYFSKICFFFLPPLENSCHRCTAIWNSLSNRNMDGRVSGTRCNIPITFINLYSKCKKRYTTRTPSRYSRNDRAGQW